MRSALSVAAIIPGIRTDVALHDKSHQKSFGLLVQQPFNIEK